MDIRKIIREELDDWDWVKEIKPKTSYEDQSYLRQFDYEYVRNPEDVKIGDLLVKNTGHAIYRVEKIEHNSVDGIYNMSGSKVHDEVFYKVRNIATKKTSILTLYKKIGVSYPSRRPVYKKQHLHKLIPINNE